MNRSIFRSCLILYQLTIGSGLIGQTFTDITAASGVMVQPALGDMVLWIDHNNDGWLDFFGGTESETFFYQNNGDGTFTDISIVSGLSTLFPRTAAVADCDNDGYDDLIITSFHTAVPTKVYRNNGGQGFEEVFSSTGGSNRAIWLDYNADGRVDFINASSGGNTVLYLNQGSCTFVPATDEISFHSATGSLPAAADYNNDGLQDIFFASTSVTKTNRLYKNHAGTAIEDVTFGAGVSDFRNSVGAAWGDMDNDGFQELYYGNIGANRNVFFYNKGDGTFEDRTLAAGIQDAGDARTCTWQEINNDGWIDLFTTNHVNPNRLYINNSDGSFTNIANGAGIAGPQDGFGVSWGDFDRDGDLDVLIAGHSYGARLLRNDLDNSNSFINLNLRGVFDNRSAIGARATIYCQGNMQIREVNGGRGATGQDDLRLHFGIGSNTQADSLIIQWPSGAKQKHYNLIANQFLTFEQEGNIPPSRFRLSYPFPDSTYVTPTLVFAWRQSVDPDSGLAPWYNLKISTLEKDTLIGPIYDTLVEIGMQPWMQSDDSQWYVVASDEYSSTRSWDIFQLNYDFETTLPENMIDQEFNILSYSYSNPEGKLQFAVESKKAQNIECIVSDISGRTIIKKQFPVHSGLGSHTLDIPTTSQFLIINFKSDRNKTYLKIPIK